MNHFETPHLSTWLLLGLAVCLEIVGALGLRFSEGFTLLLPGVTALVSFTLALYLVSQVMRRLAVSVAYPVWAGGGTAGVVLVGVLVLNEDVNVMKVLGILCIVGGVILINTLSEKKMGGC